jgi:DNA-binding LytR/AlgR family response regulator
LENTGESKTDYIFVRKDRKQIKVFFDDILYIESIKDYIKIITHDDNLLIKGSLKSFIEALDDRFFRTHRSYIVNLDKITAYTKQDIEIGKLEIPIGDSYKSSVSKILNS